MFGLPQSGSRSLLPGMGIIATATQYYGSAKTYAAGFLSNPSWDIALVLALFAASFFYGIMMGKRRIISSIFFTYVAYAIFSILPEENILPWFSFVDIFAARILLFLLIFAILYFLLGTRRSRGPIRVSVWWQVFVLSFIQVGFLVYIIIGFLPKETVQTLAPLTKTVFANPSFKVWWFILPILVVIFLRRWGRGED